MLAGSSAGSTPHCLRVYPAKNASYSSRPTNARPWSSNVTGSRRTLRSCPDERGRLGRAHRRAEELVDREQVDRQRVHLPADGGHDPVVVRAHVAEAIDVLPHVLELRVEDVRTVDVHHHVGVRVADGVAVAGDVVAAVEHADAMAGLGELPGDDRAGEASAGDADVCHGHGP